MAEGGAFGAINLSNFHLLVEVDDLNSVINKPVKLTSRVRFTCFDVSSRYLGFGANSGGIYLYTRTGVEFLQLLPNPDGPLNTLKISPDESRVGYSTKKGLIVILELKVANPGIKAKRRFVSHEHMGWDVTSMVWSENSLKLFIGDDAGKVSVCETAVQKAKKIFDTTAMIIKTDSSIVQLDFHMSSLLVSNMAKSFLCDTVKEQFTVIGTKLRDGEYGACFFPHSEHYYTVFCARPGSRLWEVDKKATVVHTHQFKNVLASTPFHIITFKKDTWMPSQEVFKPQSVIFKRLFTVNSSSQLILAWSNSGIYFFDVKKALVLLWTTDVSGTQDIKVFNNHVYAFYDDGSIRKLSILMLEKAIYVLHAKGLLRLTGSLCIHMESQIASIMAKKPRKLFNVLSNLQDQLHENGSVYAAVERLLLKAGSDTMSLESYTSQDNADVMSCSPSASEIYFPQHQNGIVVVNTGFGSVDDMDSESDFDSADGILRKWNSLPLFHDPKHDHRNSLDFSLGFDQLDGALSLSAQRPSCEQLPVRPNSCNAAYPTDRKILELNDQNIGFQDYVVPEENQTLLQNDAYKLDDSDDECNESYYSQSFDDDLMMGSQTTQFMVPFYNGYPRVVSNSTYTELLNSIEFEKLKEKVSSTLNTGKKVLLYNIKELEDRIVPKQNPAENFDVRKDESSVDQSETSSFDESFDEPLVSNNYGSFKDEKKSRQAVTYPPIDTAELLQATEDALKLTENDDIVYDPSQMSNVLLTWVTVLNHCQLCVLNSMKNVDNISHSDSNLQSVIHTISTSPQGPNKISFDEKRILNFNAGGINEKFSISKSDHAIEADGKESADETPSVENITLDGPDSANANFESNDEPSHEDSTNMLSQSIPGNEEVEAKTPISSNETHQLAISDLSLPTKKLNEQNTSLPSIIFTEDPFGLSSVQHAGFCKLVNLCIQFSVLGDLTPFVTFTITSRANILKSRFNNNTVFSSEDEMLSSKELRRKSSKKNPPRRKHKSGNDYFDCLYNSDEAQHTCPPQCFSCMDCRLSLFLQLYFHFLQIDEMRNLSIEALQPGCYFGMYFTWQAILQSVTSCESKRSLFYESSHVSNTIDSLFVATDVNAIKMIACLYRLIRFESEKGIEVCTKRNEMIKPVDVLYLSLSTNCHPKWFIKYITAMFEQSFVSKKKLLGSWLVRSSWLEYILKSQTKIHQRCKCGHPKPSGHLSLWSNENELQLALDLTNKPVEVEKVIDLCYKYSYWHGYLQMCTKISDRKSVLETIVSLTDLKLLRMREYYPKSEEEWRMILDLILKQKQSDESLQCIKCGATHQFGSVTESLTLQAVVKEMLKVISPKKLISMLQPLNFPRNQLYASFYKTLIILTLLNREQSKIADQILKNYDSQLWSKRCKNIPQQIMHVLHEEKSNFQDPGQFEQVKNFYARKKFEDVEKSISSSALLEPDRHWGITSSLSEKCVACNVRLSDLVGSNESGLTVFPCGHAYHTSCIPNNYCQQCACKN